MAKKILLVDDHQNMLKMNKMLLESEGFIVSIAEDGEAALRLISNERPDLIISDLMMPKMDGFRLMEELNRSEDTKNISYIVFTALCQEENKKKAYELGASDYVIKGGLAEKLIEKVHNILGE
ncbi:MAG: response regulator [Elusimicrobiota bacterium]